MMIIISQDFAKMDCMLFLDCFVVNIPLIEGCYWFFYYDNLFTSQFLCIKEIFNNKII